ncbi:MAG: hypothetical protein ABIQ32_02255 [Sphingomicrobium sp.]
MLLVALAQAAASASPERAGPPSPSPCERGKLSADEIVVCGRREAPRSPYRIREPSARWEERGLPKAEVKLGQGVKATAETEQADVGGFPSKRAMVRIKVGF